MAAKHDMTLTGAELIAAERQRQIKKERWTAAHDDGHDDGSLLLAAICYAAPVRVFVQEQWAAGVSFNDPWPETWDDRWDKRGQYGNGYEAGNGIADPATYTPEQRLDLLVKAGALIAAEIDRQKRASGVTPTDQRQRFEAWADDQGFPLKKLDTSDGYLDLRTHGAWDAWQAATDGVSPTDDEGLAPTAPDGGTP